MTTVWVLILAFGIRDGGGPTVIDNIHSHEECIRVGEVVKNSNLQHSSVRNLIKYTCIKVNKAV